VIEERVHFIQGCKVELKLAVTAESKLMLLDFDEKRPAQASTIDASLAKPSNKTMTTLALVNQNVKNAVPYYMDGFGNLLMPMSTPPVAPPPYVALAPVQQLSFENQYAPLPHQPWHQQVFMPTQPYPPQYYDHNMYAMQPQYNAAPNGYCFSSA